MKMCAAIVVASLLAVTPAAGQTISFGGYGDYGYYGYPRSYASTPAEGYARGLADVTRSIGIANLANSQAAINLTEAVRRDIENREKWTNTYFQMRQANRQYRAQERGPRPTMEDIVRYAAMGKPDPLSPSDLDTVTGEISWPMLLRSPVYADYRKTLEDLFARRAQFSGITSDDYHAIRQTTDAMLAMLKSQINDVYPDEYIAARNFLESLAYEAGRQPS